MKRMLLMLLLGLCLWVRDSYGDCTGNSLDIVRDCGAICDGDQPQPHDATNAINAALDAIGAASGGEVIIPPGTCIISAHGLPRPNHPEDPPELFLHLYNNLTIRGAGRKSILRIANGNTNYESIFNTYNPGVLSNVTLKDFAIDQNPAGAAMAVDIPNAGSQYVLSPTPYSSAITVSGMFFDPIDG